VARRGRGRHRVACLYSRPVNAEFNWWLLIVGLVVGGGLAWLVLADSSRREVDIEERELGSEARWIADELAASGEPVDDERVVEVLRLHRAYRGAAPPDEVDESWSEPDGDEAAVAHRADRGPMARPVPGDPGRGAV
jgi:hypothetical protein